MEGEFVVKVESAEDDGSRPLGVVSTIWDELSGGVGPWGAIRPLFAVSLSLVPFLFLGQHFNRQHRKAGEWFLIQFPLIPAFLWPFLFYDFRTSRGKGARQHVGGVFWVLFLFLFGGGTDSI